VLDIVIWHEHQGMAPDEIVSLVPSITLAEVYAALSYYFDHIEEIQREMAEERARVEEYRVLSSTIQADRRSDPPFESNA
jgi:hypothetical protein